jgi:uncharacterized protein
MNKINEKKAQLEKEIEKLGRVAVAFSSGVDSTFLLKTAHDILGENAIAITAKSKCFPKRETVKAKEFCKKEGIKQIAFDFNPFLIEGFAENPENRCYICKKELFSQIKYIAAQNEITHIIEGTNVDDLSDYRPGLKAIEAMKILSPLVGAGLTKPEIRILSKELNLDTYNKASFACLATRFPFGERITEKKLSAIEAAEDMLYNLGFNQFRVRAHGKIARIEVEKKDFENVLLKKEEIAPYFKALGFDYITLDLEGFRSGSMNKTGE